MVYEIKVEGHLDDAWASAFAGMAITRLTGGETSICGPVPDQAALYALLRNVRDLGLRLASVFQIRVSRVLGSSSQR